MPIWECVKSSRGPAPTHRDWHPLCAAVACLTTAQPSARLPTTDSAVGVERAQRPLRGLQVDDVRSLAAVRKCAPLGTLAAREGPVGEQCTRLRQARGEQPCTAEL